MPSLADIQDATFGQFTTNFGALQPAVTIAYDGVPFEEPDQTSWVRLALLPGDEFAASIPARRRRQTGSLEVQVFTPAGLGANPGLQIAASALDALRGVRVSGVRFQGVRRPARVGTDGRWYQINVSMPFETDTIT